MSIVKKIIIAVSILIATFGLTGIAALGFLLYLADMAKTTDKGVSYRSAFVIGMAQAVAILPGISRSGATISAAVLLGVDKSKSARFSFLMVVPLIFGKIAKDILDGGININDDGFSKAS